MKKILGAAVLMAAGAALAATTIESSQFGFVPVAAGGLTAVSVPVTGYTAGSDIVIAEVLQTANLAADDKLYTMTADGKYNEYVLQANKTWKASRVVTVSGGSMTSASGTPATEATVQRGKAFWIQTSASQVNIMGQATTDAGTPTITVSTGWNLVGSPSMTQDVMISTIEGGVGSFISVNGKTYQKTSTGWKNRATKAAVTDADVIPVGMGAMIKKN